MRFSRSDADVFVPSNGACPAAALGRTTHLCIAAHQDDVEIMAFDAIARCFGDPAAEFTAVVVTDGAGCPRTARYSDHDNDQIKAVRRREQRAAALVGEYNLCVQLDHPSRHVKEADREDVRSDLGQILNGCRPQCLYLHSPADKHDSHIAVLWRCWEALLELPPEARPLRVLGCEVWRSLDWLDDDLKVSLPGDERPHLAAALLGVFDSQISGGKRYDLATAGRRQANATFHQPRDVDQSSALTWAVDLTALLNSASPDLSAFTCNLIDRFGADVQTRLADFKRRKVT